MSNTLAGAGLGDYFPRGWSEWAAPAGAATAVTGGIAARALAPAGSWVSNHSDVAGALGAVVLGIGMSFADSTKHGAGQFIAGGIAALAPRLLAMAVGKMTGSQLGYYAAETANPLLGYATAMPQPHAYGTVPGVAGSLGMVRADQINGAGAMAGPMQDTHGGPPVNLLGPPTNHMQLAAHYGATHVSR